MKLYVLLRCLDGCCLQHQYFSRTGEVRLTHKGGIKGKGIKL